MRSRNLSSNDTSLFIFCFVHSTLYMPISISQFTPPHLQYPLVAISVLSTSVALLLFLKDGVLDNYLVWVSPFQELHSDDTRKRTSRHWGQGGSRAGRNWPCLWMTYYQVTSSYLSYNLPFPLSSSSVEAKEELQCRTEQGGNVTHYYNHSVVLVRVLDFLNWRVLKRAPTKWGNWGTERKWSHSNSYNLSITGIGLATKPPTS